MKNVSAAPTTPIEVCEQVIDMVALKKDVKALLACSLVSRTWTPRSRVHLYNHIYLHCETRIKRFLSTLALTPHLGFYVETLCITPKPVFQK